MSRAPWVMLKPERGYARTNETLCSTTLGWRMVNPRMPADWTISLGEGAELLAAKYSISREEQDAFALRSHHQAAAAWDAGRYDGEVVAVDGIDLDRDESIRADTSIEALAQAATGVPARRHRDRRERLAAQRRRRRGPARDADGSATRRPRAAGAHRRARRQRGRAAALRHRTGRGRQRGACARGHRLEGPRGRRAQRGVRGAVARLPARVAGARPREGESERRRDRDRPSHRVLRGAHHRLARTRAAPSRRRASASRRSASASARGSPWCWRPECRRRRARCIRPTTLRHTLRAGCAPRNSRCACCPGRLGELTAPLLAGETIGALDHDLTRQHDGEPLGERITISGRVLDEDGEPAGRRAHRGLAGERRGPLRAPLGSAPGTARSQLQRRGPVPHRRRRAAIGSSPSSRARTRGATIPTHGVRRTCISRCSRPRSRSV